MNLKLVKLSDKDSMRPLIRKDVQAFLNQYR